MIDQLIIFLGTIAVLWLSGAVMYVLFALIHLPRYFRKN